MNTSEPKKSFSWLKTMLFLLGLCLVVASLVVAYIYNVVYGKNGVLDSDKVLVIPQNCSVDQLSDILIRDGIINDALSFNICATYLMSFNPKAGKYELPEELYSNRQIIQKLRGSQLAIRLTFHNFRKKEQLAAYVGRNISADSTAIMGLLNNDSFLAKYGYTLENVLSLFIPNTYEVYWNCTAMDFWKRMLEEHERFWNKERLAKAKALNLNPAEVYTLASIVECESQYKPERKRIAGVYLNRLRKKGWKMEADPTVVYAVGDFSLKRVLNVHLEIDSPYNTYKYAGLPPGPIYMASIHAIDAVLDFEQHDYMFFCAKPRADGEVHAHAFAKTHRSHVNNAKKYWRWLRKQNL